MVREKAQSQGGEAESIEAQRTADQFIVVLKLL
jgi:hypothetical protein